MEPVSAKAARIVAIAAMLFGFALAMTAVFDRASIDRFPALTGPFVFVAAIAYTVVGAAAWRMARATEPTVMLTRYRYLLLSLLAAYGVSFLPLGVAVLPLGAAAVVASESDEARAIVRVLRVFVLASLLLAATAFVVAARAEEVFRQRLEGLVQLTSLGLGSWHLVAGALAALQLPALAGFAAAPNPASWQRFVVAYRRTWLSAAIATVLIVAVFLMTIALIHLERSSGPPR